MRRRRKRIVGGAAVVLFATVLGFAVSAGLSTSAGVLSANSGCTLTNGCESLLGFAGTTPTSPAIGTTTTVYFLDENGLGTTVDAVLTGPGVDESLPVTATAITEIPSDGLFAYNPQYRGFGAKRWEPGELPHRLCLRDVGLPVGALVHRPGDRAPAEQALHRDAHRLRRGR